MTGNSVIWTGERRNQIGNTCTAPKPEHGNTAPAQENA